MFFPVLNSLDEGFFLPIKDKEDMEPLPYEKILQDLEQFLQLCSSTGLRERTGRFTQYRREILALMDAMRRSLSGQDEEQLDRYLVALVEGTEVSLMLPYLQQCERTAVYSKIKDCLKGPFKLNDENTTSNRPRNIQFELFLANILWQAGLKPVLGEHPDLKCRVENKWFFFECKRLFSPSPQMLRKRIREAADQIQENRKKASPGTLGIIAISLTRRLNSSQAAIPILNEQQGREELARWLTDKAQEVRDAWEPLFDEKIVGILFYAASPFDDLEAGFYKVGRHFIGVSLIQESSPDYIAVRRFGEAMKATQY